MKANTKRGVETAAFWDRGVCLDCDEVLEVEEVIEDRTCPSCGADAVFPATTLVRIAEFFNGLDS